MCLNNAVVFVSAGKVCLLIRSEYVEIDKNQYQFLLDSAAKLEFVSFISRSMHGFKDPPMWHSTFSVFRQSVGVTLIMEDVAVYNHPSCLESGEFITTPQAKGTLVGLGIRDVSDDVFV